jgi:hypothetical protein
MCIEYRQVEIEENTLLFEEGDTGNTAYLLRRGRIELSKYIDGRKRVFSIQKAPVMFGEMPLIMKDHQRTASARAVEDCELVEVSKEAFNIFLKESPQMMQTTLELLVQRLKDCTTKAMQSPDVGQAVINAISLLNDHRVGWIEQACFVRQTAAMLALPEPKIKDVLDLLVQGGILEKRITPVIGGEVRVAQQHHFHIKAAQVLLARQVSDEEPCA